jgi:hypothetical protein
VSESSRDPLRRIRVRPFTVPLRPDEFNRRTQVRHSNSSPTIKSDTRRSHLVIGVGTFGPDRVGSSTSTVPLWSETYHSPLSEIHRYSRTPAVNLAVPLEPDLSLSLSGRGFDSLGVSLQSSVPHNCDYKTKSSRRRPKSPPTYPINPRSTGSFTLATDRARLQRNRDAHEQIY